jgi:hypothetical protein
VSPDVSQNGKCIFIKRFFRGHDQIVVPTEPDPHLNASTFEQLFNMLSSLSIQCSTYSYYIILIPSIVKSAGAIRPLSLSSLDPFSLSWQIPCFQTGNYSSSCPLPFSCLFSHCYLQIRYTIAPLQLNLLSLWSRERTLLSQSCYSGHIGKRRKQHGRVC